MDSAFDVRRSVAPRLGRIRYAGDRDGAVGGSLGSPLVSELLCAADLGVADGNSRPVNLPEVPVCGHGAGFAQPGQAAAGI
jgi:hypothetical protein